MARVMRRKRRCDDDIFYCSCTKERGNNKKTLHSTARDHCVTFSDQRLHASGAACCLAREHLPTPQRFRRDFFSHKTASAVGIADGSAPVNGQASMPFTRLRWSPFSVKPQRNLLWLFSVCAHRDSLHEVIVREVLRALLDSLPLTVLVSEIGRQFQNQ